MAMAMGGRLGTGPHYGNEGISDSSKLLYGNTVFYMRSCGEMLDTYVLNICVEQFFWIGTSSQRGKGSEAAVPSMIFKYF